MGQVLIVNDKNEPTGTADFFDAQKKGLIHRIVRAFIFNSQGQLYIQKRSMNVHSAPGLWDQSVGGWVDAGETNLEAITRETAEELGLSDLTFTEVGTYYDDTSKNVDGDVLKRFSIVYKATANGSVTLDNSEVAEGTWVDLDQLETHITKHPDEYTDGFIQALSFFRKHSVSSF